MQEEFLALVFEERERGWAVFLSSHELDEVQRVCDRVGIVRGGRLIAVERMADLLGKARRRFRVELADAELAGHHVVDLEATHPSLEEVFLGYYEEGEAR